MVISLTIDPTLVTRINNIIPALGYVYNSANTGSTDLQQRPAFVKSKLTDYLRSMTMQQEIIQAQISASNSTAPFDTSLIT